MRRLKILGRYKKDDVIHYSLFFCLGCNKEVVRQSSNGIRQEHCGCMPINFKHGNTGSELYSKWVNMKTRCGNPKATQYPWYGAKGISYVSTWKSYEVFQDWSLDNGYKEGSDLVLSRIDHDKDYSPSNCIYISRSDNCRDAMERRWDEKAVESYEVYVA